MLHGSYPKSEPKPKKRGHVLQKAHEIINGERQDSYGSPEDSFRLIGEYWTSYLIANGWGSSDRLNVTAKEVAEMMMLFKIARMSGQKPAIDNYTDLCGYAGIAADMVE